VVVLSPAQGYRNPVLRGVNADPSVCRRGSEYFLATSSMELHPGLPVYRSRDLVHWRLAGHGLTSPPLGPSGERMIYAPTLRHHAGRFYLVSTDVAGAGNFLLSAAEPEGPWEGPFPVDGESFDPSLCFAADGTVYYTRRGRMQDKDIVQAEIDPATGRLLTPLRSVAAGFVSDDAEGPHLYEIGGYYYLLLAEGGSRALHMVTAGRADSPWGPFEPCPWNPILAQHHAWWHETLGAGHGDLVMAGDGSWWMTFLATRHPSYDALSHLGRETFLAPVSWRDGWPVVDPAVTRRLQVEAPTLPLAPWPRRPEREDFDSPVLDGCWVTTLPDATAQTAPVPVSDPPRATGVAGEPHRGPDGRPTPGGAPELPWWSLTERPGHLRLWDRGVGPPGDPGAPGAPGDVPGAPAGAAGAGGSSFAGRSSGGAGRTATDAAALADPAVSDVASRPADQARGPARLLARRQEDLDCSVAAAVDFEPGPADEGGLSVYQTAAYRYDLVVARRGGRRVAFLRRRVGDLLVEGDEVILPPGPLVLRIDADPEEYRFSVETAGGAVPLGSGATRLISSELARAWSGALVGMWVTAGAAEGNPADFDWFSYAGRDARSGVSDLSEEA